MSCWGPWTRPVLPTSQDRQDQDPGSELGLGQTGQDRGEEWGAGRAAGAWRVALWPRGFSNVKPTEFRSSEHRGLISQKPGHAGASGLVLCLPGTGSGRGRGSPAPFAPNLALPPPPTAEANVLGTAPSRALPPVSPAAGVGLRGGLWGGTRQGCVEVASGGRREGWALTQGPSRFPWTQSQLRTWAPFTPTSLFPGVRTPLPP